MNFSGILTNPVSFYSMPWAHNMFETCRPKPRPPPSPAESPEEILKRYMDQVGLHMHGSIQEWQNSQPALTIDYHHPQKLNGRELHNVYCRKKLRSAEEIFHDVMYKSRVKGKHESPITQRFEAVPAKVVSRLLVGGKGKKCATQEGEEDKAELESQSLTPRAAAK